MEESHNITFKERQRVNLVIYQLKLVAVAFEYILNILPTYNFISILYLINLI